METYSELVPRIIDLGGTLEVRKARIEADRKQGNFAPRI